ncbi:hypothetical protein SKAU_G00290580 [Synaphobranchus kaupii]|uniref:Uncharacterized protein n=1 Tax=Synaphobranchus kaupii TaxID=118154 RepID=A0A9Q1ETV0_SYNKA|nr:hypothetical protein SKAU_G00290580 [Synaphobranchus kaupii]
MLNNVEVLAVKYCFPFTCGPPACPLAQFTVGHCSPAPDHGARLSPRRTRPTAIPIIPRAETRWRRVAAAVEQCLGFEDSKERLRGKNTNGKRPAVVMHCALAVGSS